jgi:hypothetical protein
VKFGGIARFLLLFVGVCVVLGALAAIIHSAFGPSDATAVNTANAEAQAVSDHLQGKIGFPGTFKDFCGEPDHFRNAPNGALMWVYEEQKVVVSFIKLKKTDEYWQLMYNVYDPVGYAEWGEIKPIDPKTALARIGCKMPANLQDVLRFEKSTHEDFVYQAAFAGVRDLRKGLRDSAGFRISGAQIMDDGSVCYRYGTRQMNETRAVLLNGDLIRSTDGRFGAAWHAECEGKSGRDEAADLMKLLATWDHSS